MEAYYRADWPRAIELYGEVLTQQPNRPGAAAKLAAAERECKLTDLYTEGLRLLDAGQPTEAAGHFEAVQALSPGYRQVEGLLTRARQELNAHRTAEEQRAARPGKPTTFPEEIKPRPKPKDLPH